jgi:Arc-like DNA binding dprotein
MLYILGVSPWERGGMARKLTDEVQLKLRFPEALRRPLAREARRNKRSMNAEIVARLNQSLLSQGADLTTAVAEALVAGMNPEIVRKIVEIMQEKEVFDFGAKMIEEQSK